MAQGESLMEQLELKKKIIIIRDIEKKKKRKLALCIPLVLDFELLFVVLVTGDTLLL